MSIIKKGYRVTVVSWENDADNYNTKSCDGLSKKGAQFDVDMLALLQGGRGFGNMYQPKDSELKKFKEAIAEVAQKHDEVSFDIDAAMDLYYDYCGGSEFYTRFVEKITVEFIPEEIHIQDVTKEFV